MTLCFEPRQSLYALSAFRYATKLGLAPTALRSTTILPCAYCITVDCTFSFLFSNVSCIFYSSGRVSGRLSEKLLTGLEVKQKSIRLYKRMGFHSQAVTYSCNCFVFVCYIFVMTYWGIWLDLDRSFGIPGKECNIFYQETCSLSSSH